MKYMSYTTMPMSRNLYPKILPSSFQTHISYIHQDASNSHTRHLHYAGFPHAWSWFEVSRHAMRDMQSRGPSHSAHGYDYPPPPMPYLSTYRINIYSEPRIHCISWCSSQLPEIVQKLAWNHSTRLTRWDPYWKFIVNHCSVPRLA